MSFLFFTLSSSCPAAVMMPDAERLQRLGAGEVLVLESGTEESVTFIHAQALAQVEARPVWDIITSCERAFVYVRGLKICERLDDEAGRVVIRQVVKRSWAAPTQDYSYESLREPYREIRFSLVDGSLKVMEGSWQFVEIPEGLLLDYRFRVQPGTPAPKFIIQSIINQDTLNLMACIRGMAAGSGSAKQSESDLGDCPGDLEAGE